MGTIFAEASISKFFEDSWGISPDVALMLAAFIHAFLLINFFAVVPLIFIWAERKISGRIQDRLGPTRVGGRFGWLQGLADGVKLIQKEDLVPKAADSMLFRMAPYIVCAASFAAFMFLPFSDGWVAVAADVGLFALFAVLSIEVLGIILAGYSSGSKWSLYGGMREAAQMVSYEIPLALSALLPVVVVGSLNLQEIGVYQTGWFWNWLIFNDPFCFIGFFVYFVVATASCKRAPFDLAEAESELVGGFHTEYSGMRWSFFFMAEYASMFLVSAVGAYLFLGGWFTGIGPLDAWVNGIRARGAAADGFVLSSYIANLFGMFVIASKGTLLVCVQIWLRWTLPRLRIDQVMMTCLKYLVPITCFLFLGVVLWPLAMNTALGRPTLIDWKTKPAERMRERTTTTEEPRQRVESEKPRTAKSVDETPRTAEAVHETPRTAEAPKGRKQLAPGVSPGKRAAVNAKSPVGATAAWQRKIAVAPSGLSLVISPEHLGLTPQATRFRPFGTYPMEGRR